MRTSARLLTLFVIGSGTVMLSTQGCQPTQDGTTIFVNEKLVLPETTPAYQMALDPALHDGATEIPTGNMPNFDERAELGRVLFYDRKLSVNNSTSCSSCHEASLGFADNTAVSQGMQTIDTRRNSPGIANLAFQFGFFWDGRRDVLEDMVLDPIRDHVEMGISDVDAVCSKLAKFEEYAPLFAAAYGDDEITEERLRFALGAFVRSMISTDSRQHQYLRGDIQLNGQEMLGEQVFNQNCRSCHGGANFNGWGSANIGLEMEYTDLGVGGWTGGTAQEGAFMVPGLRNVALTAPYMHDGRFQTLEQVIDHYSQGIVLHDNLDYRLIDPESLIFFDDFFFGGPGGSGWEDMGAIPIRMNFSLAEKQALVAFLNTLTDHTMIQEERFQNPWVTAQ